MQADSNGVEVNPNRQRPRRCLVPRNWIRDAGASRHQRHSPPKIMDRSPGGRGAYQSGTSTQSSGSSTLRKGWLCLIASMKLARPTYTQLTVTAHCGHLPLQSIPSEQSHAFLGQEGRSRGGVRRPIAAAQGQIDGGGRQGR